MKLGRVAANGTILCASIALSMLLCEAGVRLLLNPADYLTVNTVKDSVLGRTTAPFAAGFDKWGFRNKQVPATVDVVAIGDSHTYGNTATMNDAWPAVLSRRTGLTVYNLALGGYGPNQYHHLLLTKGLSLHPRWVVCGLYMGDDFENAFSITYGLDYWASYRHGTWGSVDPDIWDPRDTVWASGLRTWLSQHSVLYRLVVHGPVVSWFKARWRFKEAVEGKDPLTTAIVIEERHIREAFRPIGVANSLDQTKGPVREGMRITLQLLREMDRACRRDGCRFVVVIIPTKETVFARYLEMNPQLHLRGAIDRVIKNEEAARTVLVGSLERAGIAYVDALPALREAVGGALYAPTTRDMHPGRNGYRVIGKVVAGYLQRLGVQAGASPTGEARK